MAMDVAGGRQHSWRMDTGRFVQFDQVRRASLSISLNTAEGAGEFKPAEKARFYRMARRSATEAAAVLDNFVDRGVLLESDIETARTTLHRIAGALTRLIRSCDPLNAHRGRGNVVPGERGDLLSEGWMRVAVRPLHRMG
ncbi:MAG TPA: four helix bundle protein [Longimicrobiales bacterium]|nr:four helix bundle protein [Longimicrobiales bacterium]